MGGRTPVYGRGLAGNRMGGGPPRTLAGLFSVRNCLRVCAASRNKRPNVGVSSTNGRRLRDIARTGGEPSLIRPNSHGKWPERLGLGRQGTRPGSDEVILAGT